MLAEIEHLADVPAVAVLLDDVTAAVNVGTLPEAAAEDHGERPHVAGPRLAGHVAGQDRRKNRPASSGNAT